MPVKNCPVCGRIFEDLGVNEVCTSCIEGNESEFSRVRDYLYQYPNRNIVEVSEATGVSIEKLKRYLRNDRLVAINNNSSSLLDCKKCGMPIPAGNYCSECQKEIDNELKKSSSAYMGSRYRDVKMHTRNTKR
jgi:predicted amidophosphoribosyltransferase